MKFFYINLDSRLDRRRFQEKQYIKLGLKAQRIAAIHKDDCQVHKIITDVSYQLRHDQIACTLSHLKA